MIRLANSTVLIVEDNNSLRETLYDILSIHHKVYKAESGTTALETLETLTPDLILLDIMLPFPLDGFSILRILKNEPKLSSIPVILISALSSEQKISEGLEMGANDYIVKPFVMNELLLKTRNLIAIRQKMKQHFENDTMLKIATDTIGDFESDFKRKFESIAENMIENSDNTIPSIAEKMSMSISTLERWTKKIYGMTPKKFILNIKIIKAEILLRQNMGSVKDVAYTMGFNSVPYFCLCFRKKYGNSPKSFTSYPEKIQPPYKF